jgi:hypothetical protein
MDQIQLLERHYSAFINQKKPKDFFIGMADYLDFTDAIPDFEEISTKIFSEGKPLQEELNINESQVMKRFEETKGAILEYIKSKGIKNDNIVKILSDYDDWKTGKIVGSSGLPHGLNYRLQEIIKILYQSPEHKNFASSFIQFSKSGDTVERYLPIKEYEEYREIESEVHRQNENSLWGQLNEISWLYQIIKKGRAHQKKLNEEHEKNGSNKVWWDALNHKLLLEEWHSVEDGNNREKHFFIVEKIRPWLIRFHNKILTEYSLKQLAPATKTPVQRYENGIFYTDDKSISIAKDEDSNQHAILSCFKDSLEKVLPNDEVWYAMYGTEYVKDKWRKIYRATQEINKKIEAKTGKTRFFISTSKQLRIDPRYLTSYTK